MLTTSPLFIGNFRQDGRKAKETRTISIEMGIIKESSGSCMLTMGETKMIEWIKRPKEGKGKKQENKKIKPLLLCPSSVHRNRVGGVVLNFPENAAHSSSPATTNTHKLFQVFLFFFLCYT